MSVNIDDNEVKSIFISGNKPNEKYLVTHIREEGSAILTHNYLLYPERLELTDSTYIDVSTTGTVTADRYSIPIKDTYETAGTINIEPKLVIANNKASTNICEPAIYISFPVLYHLILPAQYVMYIRLSGDSEMLKVTYTAYPNADHRTCIIERISDSVSTTLKTYSNINEILHIYVELNQIYNEVSTHMDTQAVIKAAFSATPPGTAAELETIGEFLINRYL